MRAGRTLLLAERRAEAAGRCGGRRRKSTVRPAGGGLPSSLRLGHPPHPKVSQGGGREDAIFELQLRGMQRRPAADAGRAVEGGGPGLSMKKSVAGGCRTGQPGAARSLRRQHATGWRTPSDRSDGAPIYSRLR